jgi:hypothetical protein
MTKSYKTTLALSVIAATAIAFVLGPALIQSAAADPAPKTVERCSDPKFAERTSCPGNSEDAASDKRDDQCIARNPGQAKNCPDGATDTVNPPNK